MVFKKINPPSSRRRVDSHLTGLHRSWAWWRLPCMLGLLFEPPSRRPGPPTQHRSGRDFPPRAPRPLTAQHEEQHAGQGGHDHQQGQPDALPHAARSPPARRAAPRAGGAGGGPHASWRRRRRPPPLRGAEAGRALRGARGSPGVRVRLPQERAGLCAARTTSPSVPRALPPVPAAGWCRCASACNGRPRRVRRLSGSEEAVLPPR